MKKKIISLICLCSILFGTVATVIPIKSYAASEETETIERSDVPMKLWYTSEAPKINENEPSASGSKDGDLGWEYYSLPIGNGYFGASVFGRTDTERVQLTDKTLSNPEYFKDSNGKNYTAGGLNNFSETYIDFGHTDVSDYIRYLDLNTAISGVEYTYNGVKYTREYFASYPDNALVIRLDANSDGALSFTLRPTVPFEQSYAAFEGDGGSKSGTVESKVENNVGYVELSGKMDYYGIDFYGLYKVYTDGGKISASTTDITYTDKDGTSITDTDGTIVVSDANSAYIVVTFGTDYELSSETFTETRENKPTQFTDLEYAKAKVLAKMNAIDSKIKNLGFNEAYQLLKKTHTDDYSDLFGRVDISLGFNESDLSISTDKLISDYKAGKKSTYLEALLMQYGRYLLIASSRSGSMPANLQGAWNAYNNPAWGSGYWHNINVQMNYWHAFSTNLAETFEAYIDFNAAYMAQTEKYATDEIATYNPDALGKDGGNGWVIGTTNYQNDLTTDRLSVGNLGFTTQLFWEYYSYTKEETVLRKVYDVLANAARFITKAVELDEDGHYLVSRSDSPEMRVDGSWYETKGTTYSQTFAYLNNYNALLAAEELGILQNEELLATEEYSILKTVMEQIDKYDPIVVGLSGQVKEFREETYYCSLGDDPHHRHISQLVGLFPGNLITPSTPAWLDAAKVTLDERGNNTTGGWVYSNRIGLFARAEMAEKAYGQLDALISKSLQPNLFTRLWHVFQIDANFGATAGMTEMLLQSHDGCISPLAALPAAWSDGSYTGLVAHGNFEVSAAWSDGLATQFDILSKKGGNVSVRYPSISRATVVKASNGEVVEYTSSGDIITFNTEVGETYVIRAFEKVEKPAAPTELDFYRFGFGSFNLYWKASENAVSYNVYVAEESAPDYTLLGNVSGNEFRYTPKTEKYNLRTTFAVTAVSDKGVESERALCYFNPIDTTATINDVSGHILESGKFQVVVDANEITAKYKLYELADGDTEYSLIAESGYPVITVDTFNAESKYAISGVSFYDGTESDLKLISRLNGGSASFNSNNVFDGKEFIGATNAPSTGTTYAYSKLTDGIIDRDNITNGRFACTKNRQADGTLDLGGKYLLSNLRIYVFGVEYGTNLTIDVFANGEWKTVFFKETVAEIKEYLNASDNCLYIDLDAVEAEKVRFYAKTSAETEYYVSYFEMECSGILVEDFGEYSENILSGKTFIPTTAAKSLLYNSYWDYPLLTDGMLANSSGRFSTKKHGDADLVYAEAAVNLGNEYVLSKIKIYDYIGGDTDYSDNTAYYLGKNFKLEVFSGGKWVTLASYANNSDIPMSLRVKSGKTGHGEGWLEFDAGNIKASAIRFYCETIDTFSVSIYEIKCSAYLPEAETKTNILSGKTFVPTDEAYAQVFGDDHTKYGYGTLTDGNKSANSGRFSSKYSTFADATIDLGGEYALSTVRFYDFVKDTTYESLTENYMGNNFKLEVFSDGVWVTVADYASVTDLIKYHRIRTGVNGHSQGWLDIGVDGIKATKIRFSSKAVSGTTVSINEIEAFGTQIASYGEHEDNILLNKPFVPTNEVKDFIYNSTFGYNKLTNGTATGNDRLSTKTNVKIDATVDLGGRYILDVLRIYEHSDNNTKGTAKFVGQNFRIEVLTNGKWITAVSYASNDDIETNHRVSGSSLGCTSWLEFDMGGIIAEKIRIYSESLSDMAVSIKEITCSGYELSEFSDINDDNLLANATASLIKGTAASEHPLSNATDGNDSTYFEAKATDTYTVEYDLGYIRSVHELKICELIDPANLIGGVLSTASDKTTIEVYNGNEWLTVVSNVSLDTKYFYNTFSLYDIECSKIRITFKNTRLFDSETTYRCAKIGEIICTYRNIGTDRSSILEIYKKLDKLNINTLEHYNAMNTFRDGLVALSMTNEVAMDLTAKMKSYYETAVKDLVSGISFAPKTSITLGDSIVLNVYVPADSLIKFTFNNVVYDDLGALKENEVTLNGKVYYLIKTPIAASSGADEFKLITTVDASDNIITGTFTVSIPKYANKVFEGSSDVEKQLLRDVLSYIRAAYKYFDATNTDAVALIDSIIGARYDETSPYTQEGSAESVTPGLKSATFALTSTPALKFYITDGADISKYSFKINGRLYDYEIGTDSTGTYAKINIYAYAMCETVTYYIDGVETGSFHIASYYEWAKTQNNAALVTLVERFWKYCQSARDYKNSVTLKINYVDEEGNAVASSKTVHVAKGGSYSVESPAVDGYYTRELYVKGSLENNGTLNVVYKPIPKNIDASYVEEILPNVVAWGDSITYGALYNDVSYAKNYGIDLVALGSAEGGLPYVDVLENLIASKVFSGIDVANCGVGSDTTCQIGARANTESNYLYLSAETVVSDSPIVIPLMHEAEYGRLGILRKDIRSTTSNVRIVGK
ncbi:MAG: glycoside hydrolase N-terminal domain-containing protein, partial [Clostridia bacterium]|nr:glycoside hydrolase N-terminal domain-containing protein [Clostridia bacterium]